MAVKSKKLKVFVAMSGGVDSSVAAALLKKQGHEVTGVFIRGWEPPQLAAPPSAGQVCDWREERRSALRAAATLDLPLLTVDASEEYRSRIVEPMIVDYRAGRTPNPDILCNRLIKFDFLWRFARAHGAETLATGHYVQIARRDSDFVATSPPRPGAGKLLSRLLISADREKDQTYFLWTLTQADLAHTLFPVGSYRKSQVRTLAKRFRLPNADKPDSQGLCFVGPLDFKEFLRAYLPVKLGSVHNEEGKEIGEHDGAHFYTIGERRGFRVTAHTPDSAPLYIIAKDMAKNILVVSAQPLKSASAQNEIILDRVNWIGTAPFSKIIKARIRYRAPLVSCRVESLEDNYVRVIFTKLLFGATLGQSCVLYDYRGQICLGGGVISEDLKL